MVKNTTDIQIKKEVKDNIYCPHCGAIQKKTDIFCSECGKDLHQKPLDKEPLNEKDKNSAKDSKKKPFYKKKTFLFFGGLFLVALITLAAVLYLKGSEDNQFKTKVKGVWKEVYDESGNLNKEVSGMKELADFKKVALKIKTIEGIIDSKQEELNNLKAPENFRDGKESFALALSDYKSYLQDLRSAADNPSKMTEQDIEEIDTASETAKTSFSKAFVKFDFIDNKLPDDIFTIVSKFQEVRANEEKKLATEEQAKAEEGRQAQQEAENKAKAESLVTSFMNAYIAGNQTEIKKYMTSAFQKEFNYADLSAEARAYSYPESFRITTTKKTSDSLYDIYGRELQVNRESGSKWTINRHFAAVWVQSENKWLIDRWDISSE